MEIVRTTSVIKSMLFVLIGLSGCINISSPIPRNDIYAFCNKNDTVQFELFSNAQGFMKTEKWILIWVDIYDSGNEKYALHLLFCDTSLVLRGATENLFEIYNVSGDTIHGNQSNGYLERREYLNRTNLFRDDVPSNIVLQLERDSSKWLNRSYERKPNVILDSVFVCEGSFKAKCYIRKAENELLPSRREDYYEFEDYYSKIFNQHQILDIPISDLFIDRDRGFIETRNQDYTDYEMYTLNDEVIEKFIKDV